MKHTMRVFLFTWLVLLTAFPALAASPYANNVNLAVQWLSQNQNGDGSWGATDDVKIPSTVEAVLALQVLNEQAAPYYNGITWLENYAAPNIDYAARRIIALAPHGDSLQPDFALMQAAQMLVQQVPIGNSGWVSRAAARVRPWIAPWPSWPPHRWG